LVVVPLLCVLIKAEYYYDDDVVSWSRTSEMCLFDFTDHWLLLLYFMRIDGRRLMNNCMLFLVGSEM